LIAWRTAHSSKGVRASREKAVQVHLTFINASYDHHRPSVVIIQKNDAVPDASSVVAWKVIKNCGYLCYHPFTFSLQPQMILYDSVGNKTEVPRLEPGKLYRIEQERSGRLRAQITAANDRATIQVQNMCDSGSLRCHIYRDHRLVAIQKAIFPRQCAYFRFRPSILVAALARIDEGRVLRPATVAAFKMEFDLLGIARAELIMTGGGSGPYATPLRVHLQNIQDWPVSIGASRCGFGV
jgi:hypothetical protein